MCDRQRLCYDWIFCIAKCLWNIVDFSFGCCCCRSRTCARRASNSRSHTFFGPVSANQFYCNWSFMHRIWIDGHIVRKLLITRRINWLPFAFNDLVMFHFLISYTQNTNVKSELNGTHWRKRKIEELKFREERKRFLHRKKRGKKSASSSEIETEIPKITIWVGVWVWMNWFTYGLQVSECECVCIKCEFIRADWHDNRVCELSLMYSITRPRASQYQNKSKRAFENGATLQFHLSFYRWYWPIEWTFIYVNWIVAVLANSHR